MNENHQSPESEFTPVTDGAATTPETAPRRRRGRGRAKFLGATAAGVLATAGVGFTAGHLAFADKTPTVTAKATATPTPNPYGGGWIYPGSPYGDGGSINFGGNTGSSQTTPAATGGPSNAAAIAKGVNGGLVDINTSLSYQDASAAGTGIVLTSTGEILTNNHVIEGATSIKATDIGNGKTYTAYVVGYDRTHDIAVLQLRNASGLQTARIGNSSTVKSGDGVVGVGNAGGKGGTPSYAPGTITATNQSITASDEAASTSEQLTGLFATNADIEPGDSGGPLVNASGQVIGIDTAGSGSSGFSFQSSGSSSSQGFAIPINSALSIAKQIKSGTASATVHIGATAFLGVQVQPSNASSFSFGGFGNSGFGNNTGTAVSGATIEQVVSGGPAAKGGLGANDTIVSVNGKAVTSADALSAVMLSQKANASVPVTYVNSNGQKHTVTVKLGQGPPQ